MEKQIILERNLDFNQFKNVIISSFVCLSLFLVSIKHELPTLKAFFGLVLIILIMLLFLKKGLVVGNKSSLSVGYFLFGVLLKTNIVDSKMMTSFSILTFRKHPNYKYTKYPTFLARWEPNLNYRTQSYQLYLLNESHKIKRKVFSLGKEESSVKAIEFMEVFTNLNFETYNPC